MSFSYLKLRNSASLEHLPMTLHTIYNRLPALKTKMKHLTTGLIVLASLAACGSAYKGTTDKMGLGADTYIPAVLVEPGNEVRYEQALRICKNAANNRQMTAAQEAQLKTLTQTAESTVAGAAQGFEIGNMFDMAGFDVSRSDSALTGAGIGLVTGLVGSMAAGAEATAAETKYVLLNCLRLASRGGVLWQVVESSW